MSDETSQAHPQDARWKPPANPWLIAVVVTMAAFMEVLDTTIVNVSLPHIAGSLSSSYDDATWVLTSYLVANGIVLPISGSLGRVFGRKRYFLICIGMFTACSFLCGIADSLPELIVFRLLQGFFGGGLQPNQQSIILDVFPPQLRGRAFSIVAFAVVFAPVIGPTLGGWITDAYSWRWIFLINVPIGVATVFAVAQVVDDPPWVKRDRQRLADMDWIGIGLIAVGFGCLQIMLDRGEDADWFGASFIRIMGVLAAVGIAGAIARLTMARKPVVNLRVFLDRNFAVGSVVIVAMYSILYASAVLIPQLAQQQLGYTAELAGLILSPGGFVILPLIPVVSLLMTRVQTRIIIAFGFFSLGCALLYATDLTPSLSFWDLASLRLTQTFGLAFLFVPNSTLSYATMPREMNTDASSLYVMLRNVSGSIGISLATAAVVSRTQVHRAYLAGHLSLLNQNYDGLVAQLHSALTQLQYSAQSVEQLTGQLINRTLESQATYLAYIDVYSVSAVACFLMVPFVFLFKGTVAKRATAPAH